MSSAKDIQVLKLGVRFDPPCLILLYKFMKSTKLRSMPIRDLKKSSDCYKVAGKLKLRHEKYLGSTLTVKIEKFLRLLQITMTGKLLEEALNDVEKEFTISPFEDMNKLTDEQLQRRKELMDINFEKNRIAVGDPDFIYDKQVINFVKSISIFLVISKFRKFEILREYNKIKIPCLFLKIQLEIYYFQVDFDKKDKVESGWDNDEGGKEESDFW